MTYAPYAWIVTTDHVTDEDDHKRYAESGGKDGLRSRVGWTGPGRPPADPALLARLKAGEGTPWRLYSDDEGEHDHLDYEGRILTLNNDTIDTPYDGDDDVLFGPLDDLGRPDCGSTAIMYQNASDVWEVL